MGNEQSNSSLEPTKLKIRIWNAAGTNIGHVSLYLPDNYLYISFWPNANVSGLDAVLSVPATSNTYQEDVSAEEKSEDETIEATIDMNVAAMENCWRELKANRRYSLAGFNCADAVMEVLAAGNYRFKDAFNSVSPTNQILRNSILPFGGGGPGNMVTNTVTSMMLAGNSFFMKVATRIQFFKAHGLCSSVSRYNKRN